jgi:hypothetical protein
MKVAISQSNYIPWKGYFDSIQTVDTFVLYDDVQFTKRDWRSRNRIKTKEGPRWLTIPVEVKGKFDQKIRDTRVSDPNWAERHWKTISLHYSRAAHFEELGTIFEKIYERASKLIFLSEINILFIQEVCNLLEIGTRFRQSGEFDLVEGKTNRLVDICLQLGATDYFTGPSAKNYLDATPFHQSNIRLHYFDYSGYPPYRQLHGEFLHEVSIIDLLLNEGPHAKRYLKSFSYA